MRILERILLVYIVASHIQELGADTLRTSLQEPKLADTVTILPLFCVNGLLVNALLMPYLVPLAVTDVSYSNNRQIKHCHYIKKQKQQPDKKTK